MPGRTDMNIYDIAKEAGVSITTVSRVINNKGYVSEKTKQKIQEVLEKNSYRPSAIARGLVSGSMRLVAIVTVDVRVPHYAVTTFLMEQKLTKLGYRVLVCNTGENKEECREYIRTLACQHVDGVILVGSIFNELCKEEDTLKVLGKIPIVMANGELEHSNVQSIIVDEGYGMTLAVKHLSERGHQRIAYVIDKNTDAAYRKRSGYLKAMRALGHDDPEQHVFWTTYGIEGGAYIAKKLVKQKPQYTGVIFGEDLTAVGAMNTWTNMGYHIPSDISLIGCNNSEYSYICNPKLTTVDNKKEALSDLTVQLLEKLMKNKKGNASLVVRPELVVRETT